MLQFQFDANKQEENIAKHDVDFFEAQSVFYDPRAVLVYRTNSPKTELRYRLTGFSDQARMLSVVYTQRYNSIRIISARPANISERKLYDTP
jgi:hypothetical protein